MFTYIEQQIMVDKVNNKEDKQINLAKKIIHLASVPQVRDQETLLIDPNKEEKLSTKLVRK